MDFITFIAPLFGFFFKWALVIALILVLIETFSFNIQNEPDGNINE